MKALLSFLLGTIICLWAVSAMAKVDAAGIYVIVPVDQPIDARDPLLIAALNKPFVDGAFLRTRWSEVEPSPGRFNWSYVDQQIAVAAKLNKKISLAVTAGTSSPGWIYTMGAKPFNTIVESRGQPDFCQPTRIPVPWDDVFLREWTGFIKALAAHLAGSATVSIVKIEGINFYTAEFILPRAEGGLRRSGGTTCPLPNDLQTWASIGYTTGKLNLAFSRIADAYGAAFPDKAVALMSGENSFPPLGAQGEPDEQGAFLPQRDFMNYGKQKLGSRFIGQENNLTDYTTDRDLVEFGRHASIAYQAGWPITNDPNCIMDGGHKPCDPVATMQGTLNIALSTHAVFLELFKADLANPDFADMLQRAHQALSGQ